MNWVLRPKADLTFVLPMKSFNIPGFYRSSVIGQIKAARKDTDPRKKDFAPTVLDLGELRLVIARHFGFCYGVENAIEISYRALEENRGKRIFLLSQMIHNPEVNADLESRGIRFIMDTEGHQFVGWDELTADDVVIVPAFGTTVEIERVLAEKGINVERYNTTCPFVEKVWKRAAKLGDDRFTVIIHGKHKHEETRATFSHSYQNAPSLVIKDMAEAQLLGRIVLGQEPTEKFEQVFRNRASMGFDPHIHLQRIGVVNQTTMLASETQAIADHLRQVMEQKFGPEALKDHAADTRDTLCYATNDNQGATYGLLEHPADLAIVVGGYNSSNTSHLVELCESKFPTYFISSEREIEGEAINHFNYHAQKLERTEQFLPTKRPITIAVTSGASCPDAVVDRVLKRIVSLVNDSLSLERAVEQAMAR